MTTPSPISGASCGDCLQREVWSVHTLLNGLMTQRWVWKRNGLDTHPLCWSSWKVLGTILHGTLIDCHSSDQHNECCLQTPGGKRSQH